MTGPCVGSSIIQRVHRYSPLPADIFGQGCGPCNVTEKAAHRLPSLINIRGQCVWDEYSVFSCVPLQALVS